MPTCTPIYQLPYAIGADRPCDIGDTLCAFAYAVETQLDRLDGIVDRTAETVPMARVRLTVPFTFVAVNPLSLPFDTVDVDTDEMVNLANNPYAITLPRSGRYLTSFQIQVASVPLNTIFSATVTPQGNAIDAIIGDGATPVPLNGSAEFRYTTTAIAGVPVDFTGATSTAISLQVGVASGTYTINSATLSLVWIGDLP